MPPADLISTHEFRTIQNTTRFRFQIDSIAAGATSEEMSLAISQCGEGKFVGFKIVCDSTDFDVSIRADSGVTVPHIDEVLDVENINLEYTDFDIDAYYVNADGEDLLYLVIINTDVVNATGTIDFELYLEKM
jgi:hypothetical protein